MTITFHCPECDRKYRGSEEMHGKLLKCKRCGKRFEINGLDDVDLIEERPSAPRVRSGLSKPSRKRSRQPKGMQTHTILLIAGGVLFGLIVFVGVLFQAVKQQIDQDPFGQEQIAAEPENPNEIYSYSDVPTPVFPELPAGQNVGRNGVTVHEVKIQGGADPGQQMTLRVYLPAGDHAPDSLPCVLVGPAGTTLLTGNSIDGSDYHDESLPYAEAGAVTITFSLDGYWDTESSVFELRKAYDKFRAASAGMVNCRNTLEFALAKIPAVDPQRIVIAGHSSAATLALLYSEHEPRLAAAISYCPAADVEQRVRPLLNEARLRPLLPGVDIFIKKSSPMTHIPQTNCPIYLFHARDDENCPYTESTRYHELLQQAGKESELKLVDFGNHYQSMVDEGIPSGIEWLKRKEIF